MSTNHLAWQRNWLLLAKKCQQTWITTSKVASLRQADYYGDFQEKQNHQCMVSDVSLETNSIGIKAKSNKKGSQTRHSLIQHNVGTLRKLWQPFRWNCVFHSCVVTVILDMYRDVQITIYSHLIAPLFQVAHGDGWVTPNPRSPDAMLSTHSAWAVKFGKQMKL